MAVSIINFKQALEDENLQEVMDFVRNSPNKGISYLKANSKGDTAFHLIAKKGKCNDLDDLLKSSTDAIFAINNQNKLGQTALHLAAQENKYTLSSYFIKHHANQLIADYEGNLPLHIAAQKGNFRTVSLLCRLGKERNKKIVESTLPTFLFGGKFDVNVKNNQHQSAFRIAQVKGARYALQTLKHHGGQDNYELAKKALYDNELETLFKIIDKYNYVVHDKDEEGHTLLHHCLLNQNENTLRVIDKIIQAGGDVKAENNNKLTALHLIAQLGQRVISDKKQTSAILDHLISLGAKVNSANEKGLSPLHYAAAQENTEIIDLLLSKGANIDYISSDGFTPLHMSVLFNQPKVFAHLIRAGANSEAQAFPSAHALFPKQTSDGDNKITPLWIANYQQNKPFFEYIVKNKIALNNKHVRHYLSTRDEAPISANESKKGGLKEFVNAQLKFKENLEHTTGYQVANYAFLSLPALMAYSAGPVGMITTFGNQILTYTAPSALLHYGSKAYYKTKPFFHNHTHWAVEKTVDVLSYLPGLGLSAYQYCDLYTNTTRRVAGVAGSYLFANLAAQFTDNKDIQGALLVAGRHAGFLAVDAYNSYPSEGDALNKEIADQTWQQAYTIWGSLIGKEKAEHFLGVMQGIDGVRDSVYQALGAFEHQLIGIGAENIAKINEQLQSFESYQVLVNALNASGALLSPYQAYLTPASVFISVVAQKLSDINNLKEKFLQEVEEWIYHNLIPDSDYKSYALSYLLKLKVALLAHDQQQAALAHENAQKDYDEELKAFNEIKEDEITKEDIAQYEAAKTVLQRANLTLKKANEAFSLCEQQFEHIWNNTPKGILENNLNNAQMKHANSLLEETALKAQIDHLKNVSPDNEKLITLEEEWTALQEKITNCKLALDKCTQALYNSVGEFEKDYYSRHEKEKSTKFNKLLNDYNEKTKQTLEASCSYEKLTDAVLSKEITVFNLEQDIQASEAAIAHVDKVIESINHPGDFISRTVVSNAIASSNKAHEVAQYIISHIVATGAISYQDAKERMLGSISSAHTSDDKFHKMNSVTTSLWQSLQKDYKTNYLNQKQILSNQLAQEKQRYQEAVAELSLSKQQLASNREQLLSLLSTEQQADFIKAEVTQQQHRNDQFWQASHSSGDVRQVIALVGQVDAAHYYAHAHNLQYTPNFQDKYDSKSLAKLFINYKYLFLQRPSLEECNAEIDGLSQQLQNNGKIDSNKLNQVKLLINSEIAQGLLLNGNAEKISSELFRGLDLTVDNTFKDNLNVALVHNQSEASNLIQTALQSNTNAISIEQIGEWQVKPLPERVVATYTGANEKHGWDSFKHKPLNKIEDIAKDILSSSGAGYAPHIGISTTGVNAGLTSNTGFQLYSFNRPTQVLFEIPKPTLTNDPVYHPKPVSTPLSSNPLPTVLAHVPWQPTIITPSAVQADTFRVVSSAPQLFNPSLLVAVAKPPEPVLPLSVYMPSLSTPTYTPLMDQTLVKPSEVVVTEVENRPIYIVEPKKPGILSQVGEKILNLFVGTAHASPVLALEGAMTTSMALGAAAAATDSWKQEWYDEPKDQSTMFPVHLEALSRILGKGPNEKISDIDGYTFPKFNVSADRTETLVAQPGVESGSYTFPKNLLATPLLVFAYKATGVPPGSGDNGKYDDDYKKHKPSASGNGASWQGASVNPIPNAEVGQRLLDTAFSDPSKPRELFNYYNGHVIKFRSSRDGKWHSYEIDNGVVRNVGDSILKQFREAGLISQSEYKKLLKK